MGSLAKPVVCIVTPGTSTANNGNWRTAARWAAMLRGHYKIIVQTAWDGRGADAIIALHARRSAASISAFREAHPKRRIAVVLTGTDLYHDLPDDEDANASLDIADRIVVLQENALQLLKTPWRRKAQVIHQSSRLLVTGAKARRRLDCVVVGHLREEKDPRTLFRAVAELPEELPIRIRHIGAALDKQLGAEARALMKRDSRYHYLGALPNGLARSAIKAAHLLVHPSLMEGGANVISEALTSGTSVLASRVPGNVGMLGAGYRGYFEAGDASDLARCLVLALKDPDYLHALGDACGKRKALFRPEVEAREVRNLAARLTA
jgi:putative glycosyltransferase (TIGR04348 family)